MIPRVVSRDQYAPADSRADMAKRGCTGRPIRQMPFQMAAMEARKLVPMIAERNWEALHRAVDRLAQSDPSELADLPLGSFVKSTAVVARLKAAGITTLGEALEAKPSQIDAIAAQVLRDSVHSFGILLDEVGPYRPPYRATASEG